MSKPDKGVFLGHSKKAIFKLKQYLTPSQINHHVHIVGASGYGKSVLIGKILKDRISKGEGCLFIDLKADIQTIEQVQSFVKESGRENDLLIFSLSNPNISNSYNPFLQGSANQIRDRLVGSMEWSEEFYKQASSSYLLKVLIVLCWRRDALDIPFSIQDLLNLMSDGAAIDAYLADSEQMPENIKDISAEIIDHVSSKEKLNNLMGIKCQLESLLYSDFQKLICNGHSEINLFEAIRQSKIIYILLDSRRYGESARVMGKLVLGDLKAASAKIDNEVKKQDRRFFTVVVDEFADLATNDFLSFLDRARSARIGVIMAHQELGDLKQVSEEFARRLMGNTSTLFAFLQKNPDSAEIIAKIAGTVERVEYTSQIERWGFWHLETGAKSARKVETFRIHPNTIKSLGVGECVLIKQYPNQKALQLKVSI
jgi:conjugal transfer pilus assembly protein TraD